MTTDSPLLQGLARLHAGAARPPGTAPAAPSAAAPAAAPLPSPDAPQAQTFALSARGRPRLGETLVKHGLISQDQLDVALDARRHSQKLLGEVLVQLGFLTEDALSSVLAEASGFERFDPTDMVLDPDLIRAVPREVAERHRVLPLAIEDGCVRVAMADPFNTTALEDLRRFLPDGAKIDPKVCTTLSLLEAIDRAYSLETSIAGIVAELKKSDGPEGMRFAETQEGYVHPIVRLVNAILLDGAKRGAAEIHLEPEEMILRLRYRIDGAMVQVQAFNKNHFPPICHRIKLLAGLNIADRVTPQSGTFSMDIGSRQARFTLSTLPTIHGENLVLKVLASQRKGRGLDQLGLSPEVLTSLRTLMGRKGGMVAVVGASTSGKTTTLNAMLEAMASPQLNIMTVEDLIETRLPMIRQTQVGAPVLAHGAGTGMVPSGSGAPPGQAGTGGGAGMGQAAAAQLNKATALRAVIRQSPDIVVLGSLEDPETAEAALDCTLSGHSLLTTMRAGNCFAAIQRLIQLGIPRGALAHQLTGLIHQRLVRALCPACRKPRAATAREAQMLGYEANTAVTVHEPGGCEDCHHTGYRGSVPVAEVMILNDAIRDAIADSVGQSELRRIAVANGFRPLALDGVRKVRAGLMALGDLLQLVERS